MAPRVRRGRRRKSFGGMKPGPLQTQNFLPMTPQFEASRRGIEDSYAASLADITQQRSLMPGMINMFKARQGTDIGYATQGLNENMVDRGIYDSGIRPQLQMRDITIPYERRQQDFSLQMEALANELAQAEGAAGLGYNQSLIEAMLQRGGDVASSPPLSLPGQYPGPRRKKRGNKKKGKK